MLEWLKGSKVDHPMAAPRKAQEIVDDLPADPVKALEEVTEWLDSIGRTRGFSAGRRFELVDLLDGAAKNHQRKLGQDYLATQRQQKFQENRLWTASFNFWKQLGEGYLQCVDQHESGGTGATAVRKALPVIVARAMRAITLQMKWILLRYGQVEPRIWRELSRLYQRAEQGGFLDDEAAIYPGAHGRSAVRHEFLKAMMLSASSTDSLRPLRQEIAERLVAHFGPRFRLSRTPAAGSNYYFNLEAAMAPARLIRRDAAKPSMRFFGAGDAFAELNRLLGQLVETGALPGDVYVGGQYDKDVMIGVMRHLALYWADQPPARGAERRGMVTRMTVVPGLAEILKTLDPSTDDELDFSAQPAVESWIAENVSDGGCGAIVPARASDWVHIGCLIGVRGETERSWSVGVIRRVTRDEHQQRRVGVQMLSKTVIPVRLAGRGGSQPRSALLLSTRPDRSGEVGLALDPGVYNSRDSLEMTAGAKQYLLIPSKLVEGGEGYDWASYRVMQRSAG